jgi:hypothetical protein
MEVGGQLDVSAALPWGRNLIPIGGFVGPTEGFVRYWKRYNLFPLPEFEVWTLQPIASHKA